MTLTLLKKFLGSSASDSAPDRRASRSLSANRSCMGDPDETHSHRSSARGGLVDVDPMFLQAVHDKGILMPNSTAIKLAHGTCSAMRSGGVNSALSYLKKNAGNLSNDDAVKFGGLAIYAYCRELTPKGQ